MSNRSVLYPGTFDPITNGHLDLIRRAANMFSRIVVAVAADTSKSPAFTLEERVAMVSEVTREMANVEVKSFAGLTMAFAAEQGCDVVLRGLRAVSDFEYEFQMAAMNRHLNPKIETLFLTPSENFTYISSSLVRQVSSLGGDVSSLVPPAVDIAIKKRFGR